MLIHIIPDDLRQAALEIDRGVSDLCEYRAILRSDLSQMEMIWTGSPAADDFVLKFRQILEGLERQISELYQMGYTLPHQADQWELTDQDWAVIYKSQGYRKIDHPSIQG